jgi:hypothetical protein
MDPIVMAGQDTFFAFSYLHQAVLNARQTAREREAGSNYQRVSTALFAAFAVEATLNHHLHTVPDLRDLVRERARWRETLEGIAGHLRIPIDQKRRPYSTVYELFGFRNALAHGRTSTEERTYVYTGRLEDDRGPVGPRWLVPYWEDQRLEIVLEDVETVIRLLLERAGLNPNDIRLLGSGQFEQAR